MISRSVSDCGDNAWNIYSAEAMMAWWCKTCINAGVHCGEDESIEAHDTDYTSPSILAHQLSAKVRHIQYTGLAGSISRQYWQSPHDTTHIITIRMQHKPFISGSTMFIQQRKLQEEILAQSWWSGYAFYLDCFHQNITQYLFVDISMWETHALGLFTSIVSTHQGSSKWVQGYMIKLL